MNVPISFDFDPVAIRGLAPSDPSPDPPRELFRRVGDTDDYIFLIDNSSLEGFVECARLAEYSIIRNRTPAGTNIALKFGGALHKALEVHLAYGRSPATRQREREVLIKEFSGIGTPPGDHRTLDTALNVMEKYHAAYPADMFRVLEINDKPFVEQSFSEELMSIDINATITTYGPRGEPIPLFVRKLFIVWTGRIDVAVISDDQIWVMDHKTSSMGGETFFKDFQLSQPQMGYVWALRRILGRTYGPETAAKVRGMILNALLIRKPTKTGKHIEFQRQRFLYSHEHLDEWLLDITTIIRNFLGLWMHDYFPKETKWCAGKYGMCKFHDTCLLPKQSDRLKDLYGSRYTANTWSPLNESSPLP